MARFIFITGGVVSSLGKGLTSAALGALLQARGYSVKLRKLDPYLNVDPGTMSPYQHGEVYVTDDGAETDLDLGHYERFTGIPTSSNDNITAGQVYQRIIKRERLGDYLGGTVQVIPHVTDAIKAFIVNDTEAVDFVLCEIGGTVGDIESLPFLEAIRQLHFEMPRGGSIFTHLTLLPYIAAAGEMKTKPTQHSVKELRSIGIQPDILVCRCEHPMADSDRRKIALFCNVHEDAVIEARDVDSIYAVPHAYHARGLDKQVLAAFGINDAPEPNMQRWDEVIEAIEQPEGEVTIAIVGKYIELKDAYKSLTESLVHGGVAHRVAVNIEWLDAQVFERENAAAYLEKVNGILVPGGFGERGSEGKIAAVNFARTRNVPYFGICLGMQMAMVEAARNMLRIKDATSTEFGTPGTPIVGLMEEWTKGEIREKRDSNSDKGGTMRRGAYEAYLSENSKVAQIYGTRIISERHRHRYEVNMEYRAQFEKEGLLFTGVSPDGMLPEIIELKDHPWFIGVQFHPELKSRPFAPHPLFASFIEAALQQNRLF